MLQFFSTSVPVLELLMMFLILSVACFSFSEIYKRQTVVASLVKASKEKAKKELEGEEVFEAEFGQNEKVSIIQRYDRLFFLSGIRKISGKTYLMLAFLSALFSFIIGNITDGIFLGLFFLTATLVGFYLNLSIHSGRRYADIEENTPMFIAIMANYSKGSSDIVTIIKHAEPRVSGAIQHLLSDFIANADAFGQTDLAFDIARESVENRQLRIILANLKACSHYEANYETVLNQILQQTTQELSVREQRKNLLLEGKVTVGLVAVITGVIVVMIGRMLGLNVMAIMTGSMIGNAILFAQGIVYLFVLCFLFSTGKER